MTVPKLRFPEFAEEWEEKRLGAFFEEFKAKSVEQDQHEVLTSARTGLLRQKDYYDNDRITDRDNVGFNVIPPDYLTYRSRSDDRKFFFNENKLGITGIISIYYPVFRIVNGDNNFFAELLARNSNHIGKFSVGTSQTVLSMNELKRIKLPIPKANEQRKIAAFLGVVDAKIAALRARRAGLERYKRGLMRALFSPTLRFTRSDGTTFPDWEEKRLGEVAYVIGGGTPDTDVAEYWNGSVIWFTPSEIKTKYLSSSVRRISERGLSSSSAKMLPIGALVLSTRATVGDVGIATKVCATNQGFQSLVVKGKNFNEFWYYWLKNNKKALLRRSAGSTFLEIGKSEVQKLPVLCPHPDEQARIAEALSAMDAKVAMVGDQVTQMEAFKKGLLQQMFV